MNSKQSLRNKHLKIRDSISQVERQEKSFTLVQKLEEIEKFKLAKSVLLYYPIKSEPSLIYNFEKWSILKFLYFPYFNKQEIGLVRNLNELETISSNHNEVKVPRTASSIIPDIAIVPGVCFDKMGNRIGYGSGWYDKYLDDKKIYKIGVCFSENLEEELPHDSQDIVMDIVLTA